MKAEKGNGAPFWTKATPNRDPYDGLFYQNPGQRSLTPSPEREPEEDIIARKQSVSSIRTTKNERVKAANVRWDSERPAREALKLAEIDRAAQAALDKAAKAATAHLLPAPISVGAPTVPVMSPGTELGIEKEIEPTYTVGDAFRDRKVPYGVLQAGLKDFLLAKKMAAMTSAPNGSNFSDMVLPTLAEVKAAMPAEGINVIDLANLFAPCWYGMETEFTELMTQAGTFDVPSQMFIPARHAVEPFPTLQEIRTAIPAEGIRRRALMHIFEDGIRGRWKEFFYLVDCASVRKSGLLFAKPFSVVVWTNPVATACTQDSTTTAWSRILPAGDEVPPLLSPVNAIGTTELGSGTRDLPCEIVDPATLVLRGSNKYMFKGVDPRAVDAEGTFGVESAVDGEATRKNGSTDDSATNVAPVQAGIESISPGISTAAAPAGDRLETGPVDDPPSPVLFPSRLVSELSLTVSNDAEIDFDEALIRVQPTANHEHESIVLDSALIMPVPAEEADELQIYESLTTTKLMCQVNKKVGRRATITT
ncbi:hypothetical protein LTR17_006199 [Elasticomyces elasticus]|nr:hypothetical protein LTR17_006199 [Elasticomyces elasticus]